MHSVTGLHRATNMYYYSTQRERERERGRVKLQGEIRFIGGQEDILYTIIVGGFIQQIIMIYIYDEVTEYSGTKLIRKLK